MSEVTLIKGEGIYPEPEVRRIKPHRRLLWKYLTIILLLWLMIIILIFTISFIVFTGLMGLDQDLKERLTGVLDLFILICVGFSSIVFLPILIVIPFYVKSMEFIVHGNEVVVKKGLVNRTVKHCPYRNIVNISTTAGPLDRIFGIGCVNIETAGKSGLIDEPEEKLEGLYLYHEIRDYILRRLRVYQSTQTGQKLSVDIPTDRESLQRETIRILKEIRDLLKERIR
ncbi:MAG: PH domain-containing protein [Candidatus Hodarchaeota archaeon]